MRAPLLSRPAHVVAIVALTFGTACSRAPSLATLAHGLPPFDALTVEYLGMRADAFAAARPSARVLEYTGYRDSVGSFGVMFLFSRPPVVENTPPGGSLEAVIASRDFADDSLARSAWDSVYSAVLTAFRRVPDGCWMVRELLGGNGQIAVWDEPRGELIAGYSSAAPETQSRSDKSRSSIGLEIQTRAQAEHLASIQKRRRVACPH